MEALAILVTVLAIIITITFLYISSIRPFKLILLGNSSTGKTVLFHRLINYERIPKTVLSTQITCKTIAVAERQVELVDVPGNERFKGLLKGLQINGNDKVLILVGNSLADANYLYEALQIIKTRGCKKVELVFVKSSGVGLDQLMIDLEGKM